MARLPTGVEYDLFQAKFTNTVLKLWNSYQNMIWHIRHFFGTLEFVLPILSLKISPIYMKAYPNCGKCEQLWQIEH